MKRMNKIIPFTIFIISSFFMGCIIGILIMYSILSKETAQDMTETIKAVKDAVVSIEAINGSSIESIGSGFIYKKSLNKAYILTNEHVIDSDKITIINSKGEMTEGTVLGKDERLDIAVVEIDNKYAPTQVKLGDSTKIEIGEEIFVIGTPLAKQYAGSVTKGIISGTNRVVPTDLNNEEETLYGGIQFDAAINPGSSGGPLFNKKGEVIGICIMKYIKEEIEGMGFAIPIEYATENIDALEQGKEIEKIELGITMVEVTNTTELNNYHIELDKDYTKGIVVLDIKENSNAYHHLKKGDIIIQIDSTIIEETDDVKRVLLSHHKGDTIQIKYIRNGKEKTLKIKLK